jgi:hypothetical protein
VRLRRHLVVLALGAAATLTSPSAASGQTVAGCPEKPPLREQVATAPVAFIGTVADLKDEDRLATVDVIRIWRGGPLPPKVEVRGTVATQSKVHTALDRTYAKGATYLFLPTSGSVPHLIENACAGTTVLTGEIAALQPAGGGSLPSGVSDVTPTRTDYGKLLPLAIGGVAFVALGTALLLARRRTRSAAPQSP